MKKLVLATLLFAALLIGMGQGQTVAQTNATATPAGTPAATTTGPSNDSQGTLFVCADSVILDFTGTSLIGWDVFYQVFSGTTGSGTAITNLRQVPVAGIYAVSDKLNYNSGITVAAGGSASAKVDIARESDPTRIDFSYVLTDTQDGCGNPANTLANGEDVTGAGGSSSTSTNNTATAGVTTHILAPGGTLNPNLQPEAAVVVGARPSDRFRSDTPGLIFAQCDAYPLAEPGIIYDTDTVTIFWSWFTKTEEQMAQELASAIYKVKFNNADLPMTQLSSPIEREDGNFWVFYTATVGNLRPGHYEVGFEHTWRTAVNDGFSDFGPGTANPREVGICNFDVQLNPENRRIEHTGMYFPSDYPIHALPTPIP